MKRGIPLVWAWGAVIGLLVGFRVGTLVAAPNLPPPPPGS